MIKVDLESFSKTFVIANFRALCPKVSGQYWYNKTVNCNAKEAPLIMTTTLGKMTLSTRITNVTTLSMMKLL
jgi:hypothetical protein